RLLHARLRSGWLQFFTRRATRAHPVIDLGELELPEATNLVSWQSATLDPPVHRVACHPEVRRNVLDRDPRFGSRHGAGPARHGSMLCTRAVCSRRTKPTRAEESRTPANRGGRCRCQQALPLAALPLPTCATARGVRFDLRLLAVVTFRSTYRIPVGRTKHNPGSPCQTNRSPSRTHTIPRSFTRNVAR